MLICQFISEHFPSKFTPNPESSISLNELLSGESFKLKE